MAEIDIKLVCAAGAGELSPVDERQPELSGEAIVDTAFPSTGIDERRYRWGSSLERWIEAPATEQCRIEPNIDE